MWSRPNKDNIWIHQKTYLNDEQNDEKFTNLNILLQHVKLTISTVIIMIYGKIS